MRTAEIVEAVQSLWPEPVKLSLFVGNLLQKRVVGHGRRITRKYCQILAPCGLWLTPKMLISARRKVSAVSAGDGSPVYGTLEIIEGGFCTSPSRRSGTFLQAALLKMLDCLNMDPMMLRPLEYRKGGSRKARVAERANRDAA